MNFVLTDYMYPIQEQILISKTFNFHLDNPRTSDEIDYLIDRIKKAHYDGNDLKIPPIDNDDIFSLKSMLKDIKDYYSSDIYAKTFFSDIDLNNEDNIYWLMAKMCIILRFDDEGTIKAMKDEYQNMIKENRHGFFLLENSHPLEMNCNKLVDYTYLVSLLLNTEGEDYFGKSFFKSKVREGNMFTDYFIKNLFFLHSSCYNAKDSDTVCWQIFPKIKDRFMSIVSRLDTFFSEHESAKLMYISNILKIVHHDVTNENIKLLMLTSIVEYMLTRNPDYNRFNVEDSINKQFQLKTSVVINKIDNTINLKSVKDDLKMIYSLRSIIAHGDMHTLSKHIEKDEFFIDRFVTKLYFYIRCIVECYLDEPEFIEFLKKS